MVAVKTSSLMATPVLTDAQLNAIADALRAGNKIQAIKLHRNATGLGLKEAKEEVEAIEAGLREKFPDHEAQPAGHCAPPS